jgi:hemerythrin-like domain-containing protein
MTTIFEALRIDHDLQRDIAAKLLETQGCSDERKTIFAELASQLEAHAGAEERYFYNPLVEHDVTQGHARHSIAEHKELDDFIERLHDLDMSSPQWLTTARDLVDRLIHHLKEEEREIFPVAGKLLTDDEKITLAADYRSDMERRQSGDREKLS